ncbi:hypothetical protein MYRNA_115 [Mycobacterium phage Myrna]|uniref:Uncharacterized protein n=1 Tax=Mycobacterium phage Myrna TaxID=546805 RepID=B5LJB9_9CAUD|nr:gp115 [Mycobacterium phage Myrna]ACH62116.1 hypothetical protein MYRNA_115 [Mycobacterium phage Myrna]
MTTPTAQRKSLRQLRESSGTLFAKNNTPHKITCNTEQVSFELEPAGYDDSIRIVPKECLNVPGFQRLWMKKHVTISDDEEMENEITLLMGGQVEVSSIKPVQVQLEDGTWVEQEATIVQPQGSNAMTVPVDNDPTSRTYGQTKTTRCIVGGEQIFQSERDVAEGVAPLCPEHQSESHRVVSTPQADGSWTHQLSVIEAPQRGLS